VDEKTEYGVIFSITKSLPETLLLVKVIILALNHRIFTPNYFVSKLRRKV